MSEAPVQTEEEIAAFKRGYSELIDAAMPPGDPHPVEIGPEAQKALKHLIDNVLAHADIFDKINANAKCAFCLPAPRGLPQKTPEAMHAHMATCDKHPYSALLKHATALRKLLTTAGKYLTSANEIIKDDAGGDEEDFADASDLIGEIEMLAAIAPADVR